MDYKKFENIFNNTIFAGSKADLLRKIATHPERYTGIFRPTKPKAKIIQNLLQSHEIRFGDAFETLIKEYLKESGFCILEEKITYNGKSLELDQIFSNENTIFFVEQKVRDDHDSSKKRGQIDNFKNKISAILEKYNNKNIKGFFYFIDDSFTKNKNFYQAEIENLSSCYKLTLYLSYGADLFNKLGKSEIWYEILGHLKTWKDNIHDLPEINFDKNPQANFDEIKKLKPLVYRKLLSNPNLNDLLCVLFPDKATLKLLNEHFQQKHKNGEGNIYKTLSDFCVRKITR